MKWMISSISVIAIFCFRLGMSLEECTPVIYGYDGSADFTKTLQNCSDQMSDPEIIYSYKNTASGPVTVYTQINLNNLVTISDLESTLVLDLFFVLSWVDPRWNISQLWVDQKPALTQQGIAIDQLVFATDETRLRVWLPDITFTDEIGEMLVAHSLKLRPGGLFIWTRHLRLDIVQPHFTYEDFPMDIQNLNIRFMSTAYSIEFLRLKYSDEAIGFVKSAYPNLDDSNWALNSQWFLSVDSHKSLVWEDNRTFHLGAETITTTYDSAILILIAERISDGMLIRLGFPILILMVLSGLVFWAATENRIHATMTILLAVSALYIVVFGSIPMLGYLTAFDTYIISMFFILTCCVAIHQLNYRISEKAGRRPLRYVIVRLFEFVGRISIFPIAIIMFLVMFPSQFISKIRTPFLVLLSIVILVVVLRDFGGVRKQFLNTMGYYAERRDRGEMHSMSQFELKVFLFYEQYFKQYCLSKKKDDEEEDDEDCEAEFAPRMPNPNSGHGSTSIYVPNASCRSVAPDAKQRSSLANPVGSSEHDSINNGTIVDYGDRPSMSGLQLNELNPRRLSDTEASSTRLMKRPSKKRMKKQAIIDSIAAADTMARATKRTSQNPSVSNDELPTFVNPIILKNQGEN